MKRIVNGALHSTPLDLAVNNASERGLLGIALHPKFSQNGFVYLYWTESSTGVDTANIDEVPLLGNRVDRYMWNGSTLTFDRNLIKLRSLATGRGQPSRGNHNGGVTAFWSGRQALHHLWRQRHGAVSCRTLPPVVQFRTISSVDQNLITRI